MGQINLRVKFAKIKKLRIKKFIKYRYIRANISVTLTPRQYFPAIAFPPKSRFFVFSFFLSPPSFNRTNSYPNVLQRVFFLVSFFVPFLQLNKTETLTRFREDVRLGRRSRLLQRPSARRRRRFRCPRWSRHRFEPLSHPEIQGIHPKLRDHQQCLALQGESPP